MGYYTRYSLEVHGIKNVQEHIVLREMIDKFYCFQKDEFALYESEACFYPDDKAKWYSHENDMIRLSQFFPNMTFCLEGIGEDREDMWRKYFHNGIVDYCPAHISYPSPTKINWND